MVAVAPFDVLGAGLEMWSEGLADLLAHSLDGAGTIRTVSPSIVVKRWTGRADPVSTVQLGVSLGAGLGVYGRLVAEGRDSVRLSAILFDVKSESEVREFEVRGEADRIPGLSDSLAVRLLGQLTILRSLGSVSLSSLGSASPPAIREFLEGEQFLRRFQLDSAESYYRRAASLNSGLAPRESLRLVSDSAFGSVWEKGLSILDSAQWSMLAHLVETLRESDRRYPNDPFTQFRLADTHYHFGFALRASAKDILEGFSRAIELDSGFGPAYPHAIGLAFALKGEQAGQKLIDAYLSLNPTGVPADDARLIREILDSASSGTEVLDRRLASFSDESLLRGLRQLNRCPDVGEKAVRVARAISHPEDRSAALGYALLARGRLGESYEVAKKRTGGAPRLVEVELTLTRFIQPHCLRPRCQLAMVLAGLRAPIVVRSRRHGEHQRFHASRGGSDTSGHAIGRVQAARGPVLC
jgi:tetratricopeptide (TPR) repeat protein